MNKLRVFLHGVRIGWRTAMNAADQGASGPELWKRRRELTEKAKARRW